MRLKGGVNLTSRPSSFSTDGKLLLVCTGSTVSVFSVATGFLVNELEGHTSLVTSIHVVDYGGATKSIINHVWTTSLDGTVRFWNFTTALTIKIVNIGSPIFSMVIPRVSEPGSKVAQKQCICLLLVQRSKDTLDDQQDKKSITRHKQAKELPKNALGRTSFRVVLHNLTTEKPLSGHLAKISSPQLLISSQLGGLVGMADDRKIWLWRVSKEGIKGLHSFQETILHHTKALHAVAFDPTESLVAGSDSTGRILIWKNVGERAYVSAEKREDEDQEHWNGINLDTNRGVRGNDDAAALTTYHWHADRVSFLRFSSDGAYLFSGGKEAVFVVWQLETGKQQFLPRLGSCLLHCASSSDGSIFAVTCADNSIKVINIGTMTVQTSIQGIKPSVSLPRKVKTFDLRMVAFLPGAGTLVMSAQDMSIQLFDIVHSRQVGEVQVTPFNYVSSKEKQSDDSEREVPPSESSMLITHVVFSKNGSVMATAECRLGEDDIGQASCLKFWKRASAKPDFNLSTQIDDPHVADVSSLVFHPMSNLAVSCCSAGDFKVWACKESRDNIASAGWRCRSVGSYRQKGMFSADFSSDGTLLAVSAEELITLWNPLSNGLVHVLARSSVQPIKIVRFVSTHYLAAASVGDQPELTVWNLETLCICWSYHVAVEAMAVDPGGSYFSTLGASDKVVRKKGKGARSQASLTIFNASSPLPCALWNTKEFEGSTMLWVPSSYVSVDDDDASKDGDRNQESEKNYLLLVNRQREYILFDPLLQDGNKSEAVSKKSFSKINEEGPSAFASVYGKATNPQSERLQNDTAIIAGGVRNGTLLNCPSHLISLKSIGFSYIESLFERQTSEA